MSLELACFISPHGYGHATRTIALLQSLQKRFPGLHASLFTTAPESMFADSGIGHTYYRMVTDIGLVQQDAFSEDREQTIEKLAGLLPFDDSLIRHCADLCRSCRLIICDISCLGILTGIEAAVPSILVENFTWDWIYEKMGPQSGLDPYIGYFTDIYQRADYRIQTMPVCAPRPCDLSCLPIARNPEKPRRRVKELLTDRNQKLVLVSMGGVAVDLPFIDRLQDHPDYLFILAGQKKEGFFGSNVRLLGPDSGLHHPDLINGADLLICKSGYSTIAECLQTTTPICCVARKRFGESEILEDFVKKEMGGTVIDARTFFSGDWLDNLEKLAGSRRRAAQANGADQAAEFIANLLN